MRDLQKNRRPQGAIQQMVLCRGLFCCCCCLCCCLRPSALDTLHPHCFRFGFFCPFSLLCPSFALSSRFSNLQAIFLFKFVDACVNTPLLANFGGHLLQHCATKVLESTFNLLLCLFFIFSFFFGSCHLFFLFPPIGNPI